MREVVIAGPKMNALSERLMTSLLEQVRGAGDEPLLLRGEGERAFSAGLDLEEVAGLDVEGMGRFLTLLRDISAALFDHPAPTVALVNGHAIAGGCVLALCCDLRVGTSDPRARIGLNEVALGLEFPPGILRMLRHQLPCSLLERALLGAGLHDPVAAQRLGLLDEVVDDANVVALERLETMAAYPRRAYTATKRVLRRDVTKVTPDEERLFRAEVVPVWTSPEVKERMRGFLKK